MKIARNGALIAVASLALALSACSTGSSGGGSSSAAPASWPAENASLKGVNLTIWGGSLAPKALETTISGFEKLTGATVKVVVQPDPYEQTIATKVTTGDKPDLANWQPTASELTVLNPNANLQTLDGAPWLDKYSTGLKDITGILNGKRYAALITTPAVEGVYYNKEIFAKDGITTLPKNWAEFVADAKAIKAKGDTPFFEMGGDRWATQWWVQVQLADAAKAGLWDRVNTNKEQFTSPTILNAIKNYQSLINQGLFNKDIKTATLADQAKAMLTNKAAMVLQVNSFFETAQAESTTADLNKKIGFFPISPTGNIGTFIPDQNNALVAFKTGDAKREAGARQFLTYLMGTGYPDFVKARSTVSLETAVPTPDTVPQALKDVAASTATSVGSMQALAVANPDLYINLANMIQGKMTPEQVAKTTQDQFAQLAKAQGSTAF